jgi:hypothetical protein
MKRAILAILMLSLFFFAGDSVDVIRTRVENDLKNSRGRSFRKIDAYNSPIKSELFQGSKRFK